MTGYNLPPGCLESDIPGNRPIDVAWDQWFDSEIDGVWEEFLDAIEDESIHDHLKNEYDGATAYDNLNDFKEYADGIFQEEYESG